MESIGTPLMWLAFAAVVAFALAIDFLQLRRKGPHKVGGREALRWSLAWIALSLAFNLLLWWHLHSLMAPDEADRVAMEFLTAYLVEKALAVDNIFVFLMLFTYFAVPVASQQRVLIYGVLGAIALRALMILIGAALITQFHWLLYVFGFFLLATGVKMLWAAETTPDLEKSPILRWITARLPLSRRYDGEAFSIGEGSRRRFTPLFLVLVMIGITDVIFATDSIPAVFAITTDPFIVLSSNVFAVLGLRALYFLLAKMVRRFHLLSYGLAGVMMFIGGKMLLAAWVKVPIGLSLGVVALLLTTSVLLSLWIAPRATAPDPAPTPLP